MPKLNTILNIGGKSFSSSKNYTESISVNQEVDNTDGFIELINFSSTKGTNTLSGTKGFCIYNRSNVCAEIQIKTMEWKDNSNVDEANSVDLGPGSATTARYVSFLLPATEYIYMPSGRFLQYAEDASAGNAVTLDNQVPDANMYTVLDADGLNEAVDGSETAIDVDDCALFKVGDLLRLEDEIIEVTAISAADGNGTLTVIRGTHGSSAASHADSVAVRLPFFNAFDKYNAYSTARTDKQGRYRAMNFFGYGRTADAVSDGIVPGSIAIKFYERAYQEMGCKGINYNSDTGLTAGTTYYLKIAVDGGSAYEIAFAVDSSNTKFGGPNGVLSKIQAVLDTQFYTTGATLNGKRVTVGIVNGDVRFTSESRLSTSAIALTAGTSGADTTTEIYGQAIGVFPTAPEGAVASRLPDDVLYDKENYDSVPNSSNFAYDNGSSLILGVAQGSINYETGEINFVGPAEAEFVVSANYDSAHSGGVSTASDNFNNIQSISARSTNSKLPSTIEILGYN